MGETEEGMNKKSGERKGGREGGEIACGLAHTIIAAYGICVWQLQNKTPKIKKENK